MTGRRYNQLNYRRKKGERVSTIPRHEDNTESSHWSSNSRSLDALAKLRLKRWKYGLLALLLVLLVCMPWSPWRQWVLALAESLRETGVWGIAVFASAYVLASLLLLPVALLSMAAGFAYGPLLGFAIVLPIATLAAALTFGAARRFASPWLAPRLQPYPRWNALHRATADNGFRLVLLLRLSPVVPFAVLSYLAGASQVSLRHFVVATLIGKSPSLMLHVYAAASLTELANRGSSTGAPNSWSEWLFWIGLLATVLASWQLTRIARSAAQSTLDEDNDAQRYQGVP